MSARMFFAALVAITAFDTAIALRRSKKRSNSSRVTDYDCDGDGSNDCRDWDYGAARCADYPKCGYKYKFGDWNLDHSCRCQRCYEDPTSAASKVPMDRTMNQNFYGRWRPWSKVAETCGTWLMPKNDADLQAIMQYAKQNQFIVRPAGATHSSGGIVTDWENNQDVLVVSLAEYVAPGEWEYTFKEESTGKATVVVNAGWSPLQLYAQIRPLNYFLPTQTAGPVFQLGGLVANCVHGGNYQRGFLHQYVLRMRVMLHDGTIRVIDEEADLRYWRNSYGLLGFITALEFTLDYRPQFQAYLKQQKVNWNKEDFWTFLKQEAHADISEEDAPFGQPGDRQALMGQFFFNPYEAGETGVASMSAVIWRANENATEPNVRNTVPGNARSAYSMAMSEMIRDEIISENPQDGQAPLETYTPFNEAIRHWGGPKIFPLGLDTNDGLAQNARTMTSLSMGGPEMLMGMNRLGMNDGFYASKIPNVVYGAYFIKPKDLFEAWSVLVDTFMANKDDDVFPWNGPPELRFLTVTDDAVLNPVEPGLWAVSEFLGFPTGRSDQGWKSAFKYVQDEWMSRFGGKPHMGKNYAFGYAADGSVQPFLQEEVCKIYSDAQKSSFEAYRRQTDPENLFAAGDGMKLLSACP